ncbi:MAG: aldo/keto reductase [Lachnospiraceae bacterium]|nr:aldo/keto reductase [Lachnospiraceae bacterium]
MDYITLNDGNKMPAIGLGTFMMAPDAAQKAVESALASGYRLIDTANAYMNERAVGRGIKNSGLKREEVFLESKLWPAVYTRESAVDEMLERLDTDYVDLLLIHQPAGDYIAGYKALEKAVKEGKAKSIGLSNCEGEPLEKIMEIAEIKPAVIQVEAHPYFPQNELKERIAKDDIHIQAWYPLGHGDKSLQEEKVFADLATKYSKSTAQIILRWHVQSGNIVIPGSTNPDHIRDNADIFDFTLTDEEMAAIKAVDKNTRYYTPDPAVVASYATMELQPEKDV